MSDGYSPDQRQDLAAKGHALPDGSYPTPDVAALKARIAEYPHEKPARKPGLRRYLVQRAVALGAAQEIPRSWTVVRNG